MSKAGDKDAVVARWEKVARRLVGRKIIAVRYMTKDDCDALMWDAAAVALQLDDGEFLFPSTDDEGNGPGALFTSYDDPDLSTLPVIRPSGWQDY